MNFDNRRREKPRVPTHAFCRNLSEARGKRGPTRITCALREIGSTAAIRGAGKQRAGVSVTPSFPWYDPQKRNGTNLVVRRGLDISEGESNFARFGIILKPDFGRQPRQRQQNTLS